ncbi:cell envelope integrity protein TolA [Rhodoferax sp.]|uniref:cell envelope integrity protein TolA n=1 Tax=Rhodoferax sp. TaxID=50421 RepID=UPI00271A4606|nr:cell envelope integrity protein TolA [Rhodoferax sp.]MDO9196198.1 cell envelope integrity protein TolA [Rhodoferax sp.]
MHAATDRLEFAPPPTVGLARALGLAVLAHAVLLAALTWGVHWKRDAVTVTAEAELWSAVPQQAAAKLIEVQQEPPQTREPPVTPSPAPPAPPLAQPKLPNADIAIEREKLRLKKEQQQERQTQELEKLKLEKLKQEKLAAEKKRLQDKRDQDKKTAEDKKKFEQDNQRKVALQTQQEAKKLEAQRQENIKRMTGLAGATGAPGATGTAQRATGPSATYGQRLAALFKRNLNYPNPESISGNPKATVEVRVSPSGLIMSSRLITSSGVPSWDTAALRAVEKTERIPADENGTFVPVFPVNFGPKD